MKRLARVDRVLGVGDGLALGDLADEDLALVVPGDHGRRDARALLVDDDLGLRPSMIATKLLVVPRSMPMILPMAVLPPQHSHAFESLARSEARVASRRQRVLRVGRGQANHTRRGVNGLRHGT